MTKKDYIIIAKVLARCRYNAAWCFNSDEDFKQILMLFGQSFLKDNPRFDILKFKAFIENYIELIKLENLK